MANFPSNSAARASEVARPETEAEGSAETTGHRSFLPGSDGEHLLQARYGSEDRARAFYANQVLNFLAPKMREFIPRQECMFVSTADRRGECDCTPRFGAPGFIRVLGDKHLLYPEYRGNGIFASLGNILENPHIALLIIDFYRDVIGLHVNGRARVIESDELLSFADKLPQDVLDEIAQEGKRPERWVMVEVEEAYIQCSKHIPHLKKLERAIDWGTDSAAAKKGDYFQVKDVSLYDRLGGDEAVEVVATMLLDKSLREPAVASVFDLADKAAVQLRLKSLLAMVFGGPYPYSVADLKAGAAPIALAPSQFDQILALLKATMRDLKIDEGAIDDVAGRIEALRSTLLDR
jgi:predicted pyridoxine 5'-phosphate oxidase superfamily flavin-nucleotide-binding protein/truncated hemoglobin YjbI